MNNTTKYAVEEIEELLRQLVEAQRVYTTRLAYYTKKEVAHTETLARVFHNTSMSEWPKRQMEQELYLSARASTQYGEMRMAEVALTKAAEAVETLKQVIAYRLSLLEKGIAYSTPGYEKFIGDTIQDWAMSPISGEIDE